MHFTTPLILLGATLAVAAPHGDYKKEEYKKGCKKDWDNKWENDAWEKDEKLFYFDKEFIVKATPNTIIANNGTAVPGQPGARGIFKYGINIPENTICYNITLSGVTGNYSSPAITATHIHEAAVGKAGPPRLAFPNPTGPDERRTSYGCLKGPFITGLINNATGLDQGAGFHVRQIVANPAGFFTDTHTVAFSAGAVRGQLA
ncbi:hypothetical protein ACN47E_006143 [Coniothyrium glycines]